MHIFGNRIQDTVTSGAYLESGLKRHLSANFLCAYLLVLGVRVMGLVPTPLDRLHT